jgi:putative Holliday junction resolvase
MRYLGLDLGSRTLGVAVSDSSGIIASNYQVIRHQEDYDDLVYKVKELVAELKIEAIVLGFPKNMNNTIGPKGELSLDFQKKLKEVLTIPVVLQDERLTTVAAHNYMLAADVSRKKRKERVDRLSANIILQTYLDIEKGRK